MPPLVVGVGVGSGFGGSSPVTPLSLFGSSLGLWYHYDDRVDVTGKTSQWNDLSGNGRQATQPVAGDRPVPDPTAFGGRGGLRFSASGEWLETPVVDWSSYRAMTWFMAIKSDASPATSMIFFELGANAYFGTRCHAAITQEASMPGYHGFIGYLGGGGAPNVRSQTTGQHVTSDCSVILRQNIDASPNDEQRLSLNGTATGTQLPGFAYDNTLNYISSKTYLGARTGGVAPMQGVMREFGLITRYITDAELAALYAYQRSDSGL